MADDYSANSATTGRVTIGGSTTGQIETALDIDLFSITLAAGQRYKFNVRGGTVAPLTDPAFAIYNSTLDQLGYNDNAPGQGNNAEFVYTAGYSGTHFLAAAGIGSLTGSYVVSAVLFPPGPSFYTVSAGATSIAEGFTGRTANAAFTVTRTGDTAGPAVVNYTVTSAQAGADDFFGGVLPAGSLSFAANEATRSVIVNIQGDAFVEADETFSLAISFASPAPVGASITTASASVVIRNDDFPDDFSADATTTATLAIGATLNGALENEGDSDWIRVTLNAGTEYQFDLQGATSNALADPSLRLRNAQGAELVFNDNAGAGTTASQIVFTPAASGVHYLDAQSSNRSASFTGAYTIAARFTPQAADDYTGSEAGPGSAPGTLTVGRNRTLTGSIERALDQDWFRVNLESGAFYQFEVDPGSASALFNPALQLLDPTGATILLRDDDRGPGLGARIPYYIANGGTYFLKVGSADASLGAYSIRALSAAEADPDAAGSIATTRALGGAEWSLGRLENAADVDYYRVDLISGNAYQFRVRSLDLADPILRLRDASGRIIATNDDDIVTTVNSSGAIVSSVVDSLIVYAPTTSGSYYLEPGSFFAGGTGTYIVSIAPEPRGVYTNTYSFAIAATTEIEGTHGDRLISIAVERAGSSTATTSALVEIVNEQTSNADFDLNLSGFDSALGAIPVVFGPGVSTTVFQVAIKGDSTPEGDERFSLRLVAPAGNATGAISTIQGLIRDDDGGGVAPVYRFAKVSNGAYFFTGNATERDQILVSYPDFRPEGVGFQRYADSGSGLPVFRFANLSNGGYFYTGSTAERDATIVNYPNMRFEGSTFSVADPSTGGALAVYRLANLNNGAYLYTINPQERDAAVKLGFWRSEGISFYAPPIAESPASDDYAGSSASTGRITVGGSAAGRIETAGDTDWFETNLEAGRRYIADLLPAAGSPLADPLLSIWRSNSNFLVADDNSGGGSAARIEFTPSISGSYYFAAAGAASATGSYRLNLAVSQVAATDDFPQSNQTTGRVVPGQNSSGRIEVSGDHDWLQTTLETGSYTFTISGEARGVAPVLALRDAQGVVVAQVGNSANAGFVSLAYTAPGSAAFFLDVSSQGNQIGTYSIAANRTSPVQELKSRGLIGFSQPAPDKLLEGSAQTPGSLAYSIVRSGSLDSPATVTLQIIPLEPLIITSDIDLQRSGFGSSPIRTLSFAAGESRLNFTLFASGDEIGEPTESFELRLSTPSNGLSLELASVVVQLIDDDKVRNPPDGVWWPGVVDLAGGTSQSDALATADWLLA